MHRSRRVTPAGDPRSRYRASASPRAHSDRNQQSKRSRYGEHFRRCRGFLKVTPMNYFQLVFKQMRQRSLSTWLTMLSVTLGVGLAIAIMILGRESESLFGQNDYGFDAIIGKKGSKLQLVLNTIYHLDVSPGNIPYDQYTRLLNPKLPKGVPMPADNYYKYVKIAEPTVVGDTLNGQYRIVGVNPSLFGFDQRGDPLPPDEV